MRMISQVVVVMLGRVHNDGEASYGFGACRDARHTVRSCDTFRRAGIGTRGNGKRRATIQSIESDSLPTAIPIGT